MQKRHDVSEVVEIPQNNKKNIIKKILLSLLIIILSLIFIGIVAVLVYINSIGIKHIDTEKDDIIVDNNNDEVLFEDIPEEQVDEYYNIITAIRDDSDLSASLKNWYTNGGDHMYSNNVINILIVGIDASGGVPMQGNSDVMMQ